MNGKIKFLCFLLCSFYAVLLHGQIVDTIDNKNVAQNSVCILRTLPANNVRSTYATLYAELEAISTNVISYSFHVKGPNGITFTVPAKISQGSNILKATVSNLTPNTEYSFCVEFQTSMGKFKQKYLTFKTLPKPIPIKTTITHHRTNLGKIASNALNLNTLTGKKYRLVKACDYKSTTVRNKAVHVASQSEGNFNIGQICDIFDYCYNNWHYVNDPSSGDYYQNASSSINNGLNGDCDDFAILVCSMLLSIGGDARITAAHSSLGGHAFTEINLGKADMQLIANYIAARYHGVWTGKIHYRVDKYKNCWLNLDWWAKHPGGEYYKADKGTRFYILDNYCEDF